MTKLAQIALPLLLAVIVLGPSAMPADAAGAKGTLAGHLWTQAHGGPATPGQKNRRPVKAQVSARNTRNLVVARASSDSKGEFRMTLPAGRYLLHLESAGLGARLKDVAVDIKAGTTTHVELMIDNGMR